MGWHVVTWETDGTEARSSALSSETAALRFAGDLTQSGVSVLRIEAPDGDTIDAAAFDARRCHLRHLAE